MVLRWRVSGEDCGRAAPEQGWDSVRQPARLYWPLRPARLLAEYAGEAVRERRRSLRVRLHMVRLCSTGVRSCSTLPHEVRC